MMRGYLDRMMRPREIVQTIAGSSTNGGDDVLVDSDGRHWRKVSGAEASYLRNSGSTVPPVLGTLRNGRIC